MGDLRFNQINISVAVAVVAAAAVEVDKLGLVGNAHVGEVEKQLLLALVEVNYSESGIVSEAFNRIDLAGVTASTLNIMVLGAIELFFYITRARKYFNNKDTLFWGIK